jgi:hypothetical protein
VKPLLSLPLALAALPAATGCSSTGRDCQRPLAELAGLCAATFDGTEKNLPACPGDAVAQTILSCGDLNAILYASPGGFECFYDSVTHQLVGAQSSTDTPNECTKTAGRQPDPSCFSNPGSPLTCSGPAPDGGVD